MVSETYSIESKYKSVTDVSNSVKEFCLSNGIEEANCNDIVICLIEALNNVIKHSYKGDDSKQIEIKVSWEDSSFEIQIIDEGISRTNFKKPKLEFDPEDINSLPEGGMGLFIIENLMDETSYLINSGKNTFIMKKVL